MSSGSFKNAIYTLGIYKTYIFDMYIYAVFPIKWPTRIDMLLYTVPMNINGYVQFLINTLDSIMRWGYPNCVCASLGRSCLTWGPGKPSIHVTHLTLLEPQRGVPHASFPFRGTMFIAWRLRHLLLGKFR